MDELITKYSLDDQYSGKAAEIEQSTLSMGRVIKTALDTLESLGKLLFDIGETAFETAAKMDTVALALEGLTGSAAKANATLSFVKELAEATGTFSTQEIAGATLEIQKFGLRAENVLPVVLKLAAVNPGKGLKELVAIFGRLSEGVTPRVTQLANVGIGKNDLKAQGVTFNGNKILSEATKTFNALEAIVNNKFGKSLEKVITGAEATMGRFKNAASAAFASIGDVLSPLLDPLIDKAGQFLRFLTKSGFLQDVTKNIVGAFGSITDALGGGGGVSRAIFYALALAESLPGAISRGFTFLKGFFVDLGGLLAQYANFQVGIVNGLIGVVETAANVAKTAINTLARLQTFGLYHPFDDKPLKFPRVLNPKAEVDSLLSLLKAVLGPRGLQIIDLDGVSKMADDLQKKFGIFKAQDKNAVPKDPHPELGPGSIQNDIARSTAQTAVNTARALDLRKFALGGGPLGSIGVTPVELYGGGHPNRAINVNLPGADGLANYLRGVVEATVYSMQKQGLLTHGR